MSSSLLLLVCVRSLIFRSTYKELQLLNILTFFYLLNQCITVIDTVSENEHNKLVCLHEENLGLESLYLLLWLESDWFCLRIKSLLFCR